MSGFLGFFFLDTISSSCLCCIFWPTLNWEVFMSAEKKDGWMDGWGEKKSERGEVGDWECHIVAMKLVFFFHLCSFPPFLVLEGVGQVFTQPFT
ncbi:hypothetical protein GGS20DRAFT_475587 [Poronia punctata]|nr:hypothetical protein GGS20DRAFT_475587 [Poronia punctata]